MSAFRQRRTRVVTIDPAHPEADVIAEAAGILRAGGLVAFPTETVYGLGANALDEEAALSIFAAKERDRDDPLIVHVAEASSVLSVAREFPQTASALAIRFWPGPLTMVLPRAPSVAPCVSAGRDTVAVRVPRHPIAHALIVAAGVPIAAPSANRFMRTSGTTAAHVLEDLDGRIDLILDGGPATAGIESTVIVVEPGRVTLLRPGAVSREELGEALGPLGVELVARAAGGLDSGSPGMLDRHYAPRKPLTLIAVDGALGLERLRAEAARARAEGERPGFLLCDDDADALGAGFLVVRLGSRQDPAAEARRLFAAMRELDASAATVLFARTAPPHGLGEAINDRLRRASGRVVEA